MAKTIEDQDEDWTDADEAAPDDAEAIADDVEEVEDVEVAIDEEDDDDVEESGEALDELEARELGMLTEDEAAETIIRDEAAEMRKLRREAREMDTDPKEASSGERMCESCYLIKRDSQFSDRRKNICTDCAA